MRSLTHPTNVKNSFFQSNSDPSKVISRNSIRVSKAMLIDNESDGTKAFITDVILVLLLSPLSRFHMFPKKLS